MVLDALPYVQAMPELIESQRHILGHLPSICMRTSTIPNKGTLAAWQPTHMICEQKVSNKC
eukprot:3222660-Amphidinium_carterae.1